MNNNNNNNNNNKNVNNNNVKNTKINFFNNFKHLMVRHPILIGSGGTGLVRYILCDMMVQQTIERKSFNEMDTRRVVLFGLFGFVYAAGPGYYFYVKLYPKIFNNKPLQAAIFDVTIQCNLVYLPIYYLCYQLIKPPETTTLNIVNENKEKEDLSSTFYNRVQNAFTMQKNNFVDDATILTAFWIPAHVINFKYVPIHYRMPFMSVIGIAWCGILSYVRGD